MTAPMVDYKIHWLKMMSVPESRAVVGRHDGINGRDTELSVAGQRVGGGSAAAPVAVDTGEAEAGLEVLAEWLRDEEDEDRTGFESRPVAGRDILTGSSFAFTEGSAEGGFGAVWGGARSRASTGARATSPSTARSRARWWAPTGRAVAAVRGWR